MMKPLKLIAAEHEVICYHHRPSPEVAFDALLAPDYWSHVAFQLRPGYRIEVFAEDGSYWAMLIVRAAGKVDAVVAVLDHKTLVAEADKTPDGYDIKWRGPKAKFGILRRSDSALVQDGFALREDAENWLTSNLMSRAA